MRKLGALKTTALVFVALFGVMAFTTSMEFPTLPVPEVFIALIMGWLVFGPRPSPRV